MTLSAKDKKGIWLMASVAAVLVVVVGVKIAFGSKPRPDTDGCLEPVVASTVIVLDHSEAVADQTRAEILARALARVDKAQPNERVTVFTVSDLSKKSLAPVFNRCKPAREGNRMYEDTRGLEKRYKKTFIDPLKAAIETLPAGANESPIAQALIDISLTQYLRTPHNTLLVFSDALENTSKYSLYGCTDPARTIAQFRDSRKGAQERPQFRSTQIDLNLIPRREVAKPTLRCRDTFWNWLTGDNEGGNARSNVDYLPGT